MALRVLVGFAFLLGSYGALDGARPCAAVGLSGFAVLVCIATTSVADDFGGFALLVCIDTTSVADDFGGLALLVCIATTSVAAGGIIYCIAVVANGMGFPVDIRLCTP